MVPTLVLVMFVLVVAHDFYVQRRQARQMEVKNAAPEAREEAAAFPMNVVGGFKALPILLSPRACLGDEGIAPTGAHRPG